MECVYKTQIKKNQQKIKYIQKNNMLFKQKHNKTKSKKNENRIETQTHLAQANCVQT